MLIGSFGLFMKISNSEFTDLGTQLILPIFEDTKKAPNNSLNGLNRSQRRLVRDVLVSGGFEGKKGSRMSLWTPVSYTHLTLPTKVTV